MNNISKEKILSTYEVERLMNKFGVEQQFDTEFEVSITSLRWEEDEIVAFTSVAKEATEKGWIKLFFCQILGDWEMTTVKVGETL